MRKTFTLAVASGKGGTGKTTVATNLAALAAEGRRRTVYVDCDVEAPNGHWFLRPQLTASRAVHVLVPKVDQAACTDCGLCADFCRYNALAVMKGTVLVFNELCHGCGGCARLCPEGAISESPHAVGRVDRGSAGPLQFVRGVLDVGQPMSPPVIRAARAAVDDDAEWVILDAPPGVSCPAVESVRHCDYALLVAEPTPFGLHDLELAVQMAHLLGVRCGVVINRVGNGDADAVRAFCKTAGAAVLAELPDDRRIAEAYAEGQLAIEASADHRRLYQALMAELWRRP